MDDLQKLHLCHERKITFKQAFFYKGISDENVPFKQLRAKEEFSALVNWALHSMKEYENMILRVKQGGLIYQTTLHKEKKNMRVGAIKQIYGPAAMKYDWPAELTYHSLSLEDIKASVERADIINDAIINRQIMLDQQERASGSQSERQVPETSEVLSVHSFMPKVPKIQLRETSTNCWEVVMTEEEKELIAEFLEV